MTAFQLQVFFLFKRRTLQLFVFSDQLLVLSQRSFTDLALQPGLEEASRQRQFGQNSKRRGNSSVQLRGMGCASSFELIWNFVARHSDPSRKSKWKNCCRRPAKPGKSPGSTTLTGRRRRDPASDLLRISAFLVKVATARQTSLTTWLSAEVSLSLVDTSYATPGQVSCLSVALGAPSQ